MKFTIIPTSCCSMVPGVLLIIIVVLVFGNKNNLAGGTEATAQSLSASPPDTACPKLQDALAKLILKFLENLRSHMGTGIPSLGIPPLDPLRLDDEDPLSFYVHKPYQVEVKGEVTNTTIENLHTFNVTSIHTSLMRMEANVTVQLPYFIVTGNYKVKGRLLSLIPLKGTGPYLITPSTVTTTVWSTLKIHKNHLKLTKMEFNFDFERLFVNFQGLYGGGHLNDFLNTVANRFGVGVYHRVEPRLHEEIRGALIDGINKKLEEIPLLQLIGAGSYACQESIRSHFGDHYLF